MGHCGSQRAGWFVVGNRKVVERLNQDWLEARWRAILFQQCIVYSIFLVVYYYVFFIVVYCYGFFLVVSLLLWSFYTVVVIDCANKIG